MEPQFVRVGSLAEIPDGELRGYEIAGIHLAVAHLDGQVHALSDECTHRSCSLSEGEVDPEGRVVCRTCGSVFDLENGEPLDGPAVEPVAVYPVRVDDGWVEIAVTWWAHNGTEG